MSKRPVWPAYCEVTPRERVARLMSEYARELNGYIDEIEAELKRERWLVDRIGDDVEHRQYNREG